MDLVNSDNPVIVARRKVLELEESTLDGGVSTSELLSRAGIEEVGDQMALSAVTSIVDQEYTQSMSATIMRSMLNPGSNDISREMAITARVQFIRVFLIGMYYGMEKNND